MAQNENIFTRLGKLFQNQIVVRKTPTGQLKVKDVDFSQSGLTTNFIDRYNRLFNGQNSSWGTQYAAKQNSQNAYDVPPYPLEAILLYLSIKLDVSAV